MWERWALTDGRPDLVAHYAKLAKAGATVFFPAGACMTVKGELLAVKFPNGDEVYHELATL